MNGKKYKGCKIMTNLSINLPILMFLFFLKGRRNWVKNLKYNFLTYKIVTSKYIFIYGKGFFVLPFQIARQTSINKPQLRNSAIMLKFIKIKMNWNLDGHEIWRQWNICKLPRLDWIHEQEWEIKLFVLVSLLKKYR